MKKQPQILIIGSGMAGLAAAKTALESDLVPVVLEKEATLGGMWRPISGLCWNSMQANLSRYTCMFSDFPWDKDALIFPTAQQIYQYLSAYARTFELEQYIRFGAEVLSVKRVEDLWEIRWQEGDRICTHSFQFVIIATGIFSQPYIPEIKGLQDFKKPVIHSKFYKSPHPYQNKTVLVVGGSF